MAKKKTSSPNKKSSDKIIMIGGEQYRVKKAPRSKELDLYVKNLNAWFEEQDARIAECEVTLKSLQDSMVHTRTMISANKTQIACHKAMVREARKDVKAHLKDWETRYE